MSNFGKNASEHNAFMLEQAKKVLSILREGLFDAVICGGLCRDTILGSYAKDVDIIVYNWHPNDAAEDTLKWTFERRLAKMSPFLHKCGAYGEMENNDFELRQIREVIKAKVEDVEIDIIFIEDCHPNPVGMYARFNKGVRRADVKSVLADFDCPVNMFYYDEEVERMLFWNNHTDETIAKGHIWDFLNRFVCKLNLGDERLCRNYGRLRAFNSKREELLPYFCISTPIKIKTNEESLV